MEDMRFISTSHIAQESVEEIEEAFEEFEPDIVAVELDEKRMHSLLMDQETSHHPAMIFRVGLLGYLFALVGSIVQKKLGGMVGVKPGQEMLTAVEGAQERGLEIALIDQDVEVTLRKLSKQVPLSEKLKVLWELISAPVKGEKVKFDISKVPDEEIVERLTEELEGKFPHLYNVLVEQRNVIMANRLAFIREQDPDAKILVVVGAGHGQDLEDLVEERIG